MEVVGRGGGEEEDERTKYVLRREVVMEDMRGDVHTAPARVGNRVRHPDRALPVSLLPLKEEEEDPGQEAEVEEEAEAEAEAGMFPDPLNEAHQLIPDIMEETTDIETEEREGGEEGDTGSYEHQT